MTSTKILQTATCFGTSVPTSGNPLEQRNKSSSR